MPCFQSNARVDQRLALLALAGVLLCQHAPALANHGGVVVVNTMLSDNGDDDDYADTNETVEMRLTVRNVDGSNLPTMIALLETDDPKIECVTVPMIEIGPLFAGESRLTGPFVFKVADVNRTSIGETFSVTFDVTIATAQQSDLAVVPTITLNLDLDVSGGSGPTTFFEGFESGGFGAFTTMHLDQGLGGSATDGSDNDNSNGYRCQYSDPNSPSSNSYGSGNGRDCYLNPTGRPDAFYWQTRVDRSYSGTHSLYFGVPLSPELGFTTPMAQLEAVRTTDPINLGWARACSLTHSLTCTDDADCPPEENCVQVTPQLSVKHQISLVDRRTQGPTGRSLDRGIVQVQLADVAGDPVGDWIKLDPYKNLYDKQAADSFVECFFDPIDDGNDEDSFFDPTDPLRRLGPSSTCFPEFSFAWQGETANPFDPENLGCCFYDVFNVDTGGHPVRGPGLEGATGLGTWVEPIFDLYRFGGRRIRLRFLEAGLKAGGHEDWESLFNFNPDPADDGWFIDDVTITDTLAVPATVSVDTKDNSLLPGLTDGDGDGALCDNCPLVTNLTQLDSDGDLVGDACDPCPLEFAFNDIDGDGHCKDVDNCPFTTNADQSDIDADGLGDVCENCPNTANADQFDTDGNGVGDACNGFEDADGDEFADQLDNCPAVANATQQDSDGDSLGDVCDNCPADFNPSQVDGNSDGEGDHCDLNDNLIYLTFSGPDVVDWQEEVPPAFQFVLWNSYRGDLAVLKSTGVYTQAVGSNVLAAQVCGLTNPFVQDLLIPAPGSTAFYLTTGVTSTGSERPLGPDSSGTQRPNSNPCP